MNILLQGRILTRLLYNYFMNTLINYKGLIANIGSEVEIEGILRAWGLHSPQPTLVLVGGAGGMSEALIAQTMAFFREFVAPFVIQNGLTVVDGGTDSGIMRAIGLARVEHRATFPLIGVAVRKIIEENPEYIEHNHSHLLLVPGSDWGDEVDILSKTATALSGDAPSLTLMFNGGQITWRDAEASINQKRMVLVAEGSGRTADDISQTQTGEKFEPRALKLLTSGLIRIENPFTKPEKFMGIARQVFANPT